jgi:hypothetical protein
VAEDRRERIRSIAGDTSLPSVNEMTAGQGKALKQTKRETAIAPVATEVS